MLLVTKIHGSTAYSSETGQTVNLNRTQRFLQDGLNRQSPLACAFIGLMRGRTTLNVLMIRHAKLAPRLRNLGFQRAPGLLGPVPRQLLPCWGEPVASRPLPLTHTHRLSVSLEQHHTQAYWPWRTSNPGGHLSLEDISPWRTSQPGGLQSGRAPGRERV